VKALTKVATTEAGSLSDIEATLAAARGARPKNSLRSRQKRTLPARFRLQSAFL